MSEWTDNQHRAPFHVGRQADLLIAFLLVIAGVGLTLLVIDDLYVDVTPYHPLLLIGLAALASLVVIGGLLYRLRRDARSHLAELAGADAALRDSEQRFRRIFEESPLGILLARGDDHRIVQANPAFCRMLGYRADELIDRTVDEITHRDDRQLRMDIGKATADPDYFVEKRYLKRSGGVTWARVRKTLLRSPDSRQTPQNHASSSRH